MKAHIVSQPLRKSKIKKKDIKEVQEIICRAIIGRLFTNHNANEPAPSGNGTSSEE